MMKIRVPAPVSLCVSSPRSKELTAQSKGGLRTFCLHSVDLEHSELAAAFLSRGIIYPFP